MRMTIAPTTMSIIAEIRSFPTKGPSQLDLLKISRILSRSPPINIKTPTTTSRTPPIIARIEPQFVHCFFVAIIASQIDI